MNWLGSFSTLAQLIWSGMAVLKYMGLQLGLMVGLRWMGSFSMWFIIQQEAT